MIPFEFSFNKLDIPSYEDRETLEKKLFLAILEGNEGFGIAWSINNSKYLLQSFLENSNEPPPLLFQKRNFVVHEYFLRITLDDSIFL